VTRRGSSGSVPGLTDEQQDILCSNDLKRIRDAVRDEYQSAEILMVPFPVQHVA
jgi:hypothetical protein